MFGMGGSEILVILIVALLFLGPDKLPQAAKQLSKGIRDIKKQSRALQQQIESDEQIGGAIRDLKSALRGDELPVRPRLPRKNVMTDEMVTAGTDATATAADGAAVTAAAITAGDASAVAATDAATAADGAVAAAEAGGDADAPKLTLPRTAGEPGEGGASDDAADLAAMIKPAPGTVAKGT